MRGNRYFAMLALCATLAAPVGHAAQGKLVSNAPTHKSRLKSTVRGIFAAGTTTLPAGDYRLINAQKGLEYFLTVDSNGKMMVQDVRSLQLGQTLPNQNTPLAAGSGSTLAPPVPGSATSVPAASEPGPTPPVSGGATPAPAASESKVETLIRTQVQKQIKKHGPALERKVRNVFEKL